MHTQEADKCLCVVCVWIVCNVGECVFVCVCVCVCVCEAAAKKWLLKNIFFSEYMCLCCCTCVCVCVCRCVLLRFLV